MTNTDIPDKDDIHKFHLHLVSDATGTTLLGLARACLAQFEGIEPIQKFWPLVRTSIQLERIIGEIEKNPGPVIFTMVDKKMRKRLQHVCEELHVPCIPVLDPIIRSMSSYLGVSAARIPGLQHALDDDYFQRVSAVDFAMRYDDGKHLKGLKEADVILVGVSRTSKTPTSVYLARRGIKSANIPLVPGVDMDDDRLQLDGPMYVGLTTSPDRLVQLRRSRLKADEKGRAGFDNNEYLDIDKIEEEVRNARKLFSRNDWPVINVTKRSIEETAAEIMALLQDFREERDTE